MGARCVWFFSRKTTYTKNKNGKGATLRGVCIDILLLLFFCSQLNYMNLLSQLEQLIYPVYGYVYQYITHKYQLLYTLWICTIYI